MEMHPLQTKENDRVSPAKGPMIIPLWLKFVCVACVHPSLGIAYQHDPTQKPPSSDVCFDPLGCAPAPDHTHFSQLGLVVRSAVVAAEPQRDPDLIRRENAQEGSRDWQLTRVALENSSSVRAKYIEGYCSKQSVSAGDSLDILVSAKPAGEIPDRDFPHRLLRRARRPVDEDIGSVRRDDATRPGDRPKNLHECAWKPATTLEIPADWLSGVYLGRLSCLPPDDNTALGRAM